MKLNKKLIALLSLVIMTTSFTFANIDIKGYISDVNLLLNGTKVNEDVVIIDGSSYLPVKAIGEALGLDVAWEQSTSTIKLEKKDQVDKDDFDKEMLELMEVNNKGLKSENEMMKDLLLKHSIKIPVEDQVVAYLAGPSDEVKEGVKSIKEFSYKRGNSKIYVHVDGEGDNTFDKLGNEFEYAMYSRDIGFSYYEKSEATITFPTLGQYETFKATLTQNIGMMNRDYDLRIYADDQLVFEQALDSETLAKDIEVDVKGAKIVKFEMDSEKQRSNDDGHSIILGNPRFVSN